MKARFQRLYEYNDWANKLFAEVMVNNGFKNEKIVDLYAHIAAAQLIWLNRVKPIDISIPAVFEIMTLPEAIKSVNLGSKMWLDYLNQDHDYAKILSYKDSEGNAHQTAFGDILTHVANHGTHHRGQIATLLRQEDIAPPASDFLFYTREQ